MKRELCLFEAAAIAVGDDEAFGRHHDPGAVLALDRLDRTETWQGRAGHHLVDVAVSLDEDIAAAGIADPPIAEYRRLAGRDDGAGARGRQGRRLWQGFDRRLFGRSRPGDVLLGSVEPGRVVRSLRLGRLIGHAAGGSLQV